jgi:hypothetical protein
MQEQEYQEYFNDLMKVTMSALELSGNEHLKKTIKRAMFDFSDIIRERLLTKGERENDREQITNR